MERGSQNDEERAARRRLAMVERQLRGRDINDPAVLAAMGAVPRHRFVAPGDVGRAYADHPLPIGFGQTISQPYMVARMVELCALRGEGRVLEVGAGCGYQAAVLARLCDEVYALEWVAELAREAAEALRRVGVENVRVEHGDGTLGWPEHAPFDAIVVAAGAPAVPAPLLEQLADDGRLVIPVGAAPGLQLLEVHHRRGEQLVRSVDTACRFVDLRGEHGWRR